MTISAQARQAMYAQESDQIAIHLVTITTPALAGGVLRLAAHRFNLVSRGMTFICAPFKVTLQSDSENGAPRAMLIVDNISDDIIEWLRSPIEAPPRVVLEVVLLSSPDTLEYQSPPLFFAGSSPTMTQIEIELTTRHFGRTQCPHRTFNASMFPGLF